MAYLEEDGAKQVNAWLLQLFTLLSMQSSEVDSVSFDCLNLHSNVIASGISEPTEFGMRLRRTLLTASSLDSLLFVELSGFMCRTKYYAVWCFW